MIFATFQFINSLLLVLYLIQIVFKYKKYRVAYIYSPLCWFMLFYCAYFMIPVLLMKTVEQNPDLFGHFSFPYEILVECQLIVLLESSLLMIFHGKYIPQPFKPGFSVLERYKIVNITCLVIVTVFFITSCIAFLGICNAIRTNGYLKAFFLLDELGDKYRKMFKFQTVRYIAVICVFYIFLKKKNFSVFLLFIPNIMFEILAGKRTTAFLYILFVYLVYIKITEKSKIVVIVSVFSVLLVSVLFSRMSSLSSDSISLDVIIASMLGEFVNTFLTIPYVLNDGLTGCISFTHVLYNLFCPILPGFIKTSIMNDPDFFEIGAFLAVHIKKGFGLGSNCISYDLCSFGFQGLLCLPCIYLLVWKLEEILSKDCNFMIRFYIIYQLRLYMRQGYESLAIVLYIAIFYNALFYFLHKKKNYAVVVNKIFPPAKFKCHKILKTFLESSSC